MNDVNRPSLNTPQRVHCPYIGFDYKLQFICSESVYHGRIMSSLSCRHLTIRAKRAIPMTKTLFIIERKNYLYIYIYIYVYMSYQSRGGLSYEPLQSASCNVQFRNVLILFNL